jgi:hypothetical protein
MRSRSANRTKHANGVAEHVYEVKRRSGRARSGGRSEDIFANRPVEHRTGEVRFGAMQMLGSSNVRKLRRCFTHRVEAVINELDGVAPLTGIWANKRERAHAT